VAKAPPLMHRIQVHPPERKGRRVVFRWTVEPATSLYRASSFALRFPESIDLARVPERIWWWVALLCLHPHWALLRPCRVRLPVALPPGEVELFLRLIDVAVATLEAHRGGADVARSVEIAELGPALPASASAIADRGRCACAFSGGKDSLLHVGLLAELTERPLLVTTTAPMPPLGDHTTARRRQVLAEIQRRLPVDLAEVRSDFRTTWENGFAAAQGYGIAVNELTDTYLYFSSLLAVAYAAGASHLFLASEAEVQESVLRDGRVVQHTHFMYSAATQRSLDRLLGAVGLSYGSLTWPLRSAQVQELLWRRYPQLADLQYSCWRVADGEATCSRCNQCLRIALACLALGESPERMGIDLVRLLPATEGFAPRRIADGDEHALPRDLVARNLHGEVVRNLRRVSPARVARMLLSTRPARVFSPAAWTAVRAYAGLRRRFGGETVGPSPGYRAGFVELVDPLLRDRLAGLISRSFPAEDAAEHADLRARSESLTDWIAAPVHPPAEELTA
jgi:hypothetical protein